MQLCRSLRLWLEISFISFNICTCFICTSNQQVDEPRPYYSLLIITDGKCNIARNTIKNNLPLLSQFFAVLFTCFNWNIWRELLFRCFKEFCDSTRFGQDFVLLTLKECMSRTVIKMSVCRQRKDASPTIDRWIGWGFCEQKTELLLNSCVTFWWVITFRGPAKLYLACIAQSCWNIFLMVSVDVSYTIWNLMFINLVYFKRPTLKHFSHSFDSADMQILTVANDKLF